MSASKKKCPSPPDDTCLKVICTVLLVSLQNSCKIIKITVFALPCQKVLLVFGYLIHLL